MSLLTDGYGPAKGGSWFKSRQRDRRWVTGGPVAVWALKTEGLARRKRRPYSFQAHGRWLTRVGGPRRRLPTVPESHRGGDAVLGLGEFYHSMKGPSQATALREQGSSLCWTAATALREQGSSLCWTAETALGNGIQGARAEAPRYEEWALRDSPARAGATCASRCSRRDGGAARCGGPFRNPAEDGGAGARVAGLLWAHCRRHALAGVRVGRGGDSGGRHSPVKENRSSTKRGLKLRATRSGPSQATALRKRNASFSFAEAPKNEERRHCRNPQAQPGPMVSPIVASARCYVKDGVLRGTGSVWTVRGDASERRPCLDAAN